MLARKHLSLFVNNSLIFDPALTTLKGGTDLCSFSQHSLLCTIIAPDRYSSELSPEWCWHPTREPAASFHKGISHRQQYLLSIFFQNKIVKQNVGKDWRNQNPVPCWQQCKIVQHWENILALPQKWSSCK
jgi:hypothetical protein